MPRYYYDCAIQAAYMQKNFDIKFDNSIDIDSSEMIYVSPESEHIFEVKLYDDICIYGQTIIDVVPEEDFEDGEIETTLERVKICAPNLVSIIIRDNKHFLMPRMESENA